MHITGLLTLTALLQGALGEVRTASVACGVLGVGGNKGAAAVAFSLFRRQIACVCSHFAAHQVCACVQGLWTIQGLGCGVWCSRLEVCPLSMQVCDRIIPRQQLLRPT